VAQLFVRSFPLEDIRILSRAQGSEYADGRTVEAYVAVFGQQAEIHDHEGHYLESIEDVAFDRAIEHARPQGSRSKWNVGVFYNHGMTIHGTPSDRFSIPIGVPLEIRKEQRGLLTVTRYNSTSLADEVLEAISSDAVSGHSFTGRIIRSNPLRPPGGGHRRSRDGSLKLVQRTELGLREYGPTPFPAYTGADLVGVRALLAGIPGLTVTATPEPPPDEVDQDPADTGTPSDEGPAADAPPPETDEASEEHASRHDQLVARIRASRERIPGLNQTPRTKVQERAAEIARAGSKEQQ
jgi:HK97 family phage prohead protease